MFFSLVSSAATEAVGCVRSLVFGCLLPREAGCVEVRVVVDDLR